MKPFFKELFEYSHHFNQKLTDVFNDNTDLNLWSPIIFFINDNNRNES